MSLAKRSYGYGYSKPQMNYHRQNSDSMTTVVTEISRMTVNEKPCYGAGAVQKQALELEDVCEDDVVYSAGHHGGGAVQKHAYREDDVYEDEQVYPVGGPVQKHEYRKEVYQQHGGALQKHGYGGQEAYHHGVDGGYALQHGGAAAAAAQKLGYGQKAYQHGAVDAGGFALSHHDSAVQKYGYGGQEGYHHGVDGGYALQHGGAAAVQKQGYGQKAYQHGAVDAGGYALSHHDSAVQKHGYGHVGAVQKHGYGGLHGGAVQKHGYGGLQYGGAVQKHGYEQLCQPGGDVGAFDRAVAQRQYGYGQKAAYGQHGAVVGGGLAHQKYESEDESDCSDEESEDESDCEELSHGGAGVHGYQQAYKAQVEKHGGSHNLVGGVRHHAAYDRSSGHGSGTRYVSYETTKTEYSGGGYGGWPAQRKNRCII